LITFVDEKGIEHSALVAYSVTNAVNGELSVKGTIYTNDKGLHGIGRGWRFRLDDEYFRITYAKPNDTGRQIEVEFDAVHQFFYDMSKSMVYTTLNGSKPFETYLQAIFSDSGYTYNLETTVGSIRKENFGNKSRLSLFNDIIKAAGLEFSVRGHVIRILKRIGTDLSSIVRKDFNMNELKIEKNINSFVTYQRGFGAWKNDEDHSKGRYETEYESPLTKIYGRIEAEPIIDERYKETGKLFERLKENVDKSYKVSVEIDMEDLTQVGYKISRPLPGDYIMAINETLGFRQKVRIVSLTSEYDVGGNLISRKVVCNDIGTVQRTTSEISHLSRTLTDSIEGSERALKTATRALVSADGKNTNYFGDVKPLDVPKGTLRKGDRLFLTVGDKKQLYFWNGAEWELEPTEFDHEKFDMEFNRKSQEIQKTIQEARQKAEEALKSAGASNLLAEEAKRISERAKAQIDNLKSSSQTAIEQIENFKTQYGTKLNELKSTADGLSTKMGVIETYISNDGQRQEELKRYARTESASQVSAVREHISRDYVGKNTFQESVQGVERRLESFSLGTSGNLLKNSNDGFYNQHDKRYRLVETLQVNQTYTLVTKYWNGENATGHTFFDGVDWRRLNYNQAIDAWMVQFTPTKEIPAGTEITLSSDPADSKGNMDWATLVRGAIPLIHWQPAKGDVEEGVTQKLAEYKETVDGRFATISSQIDNKANQSDFQSVKETSQLYERIIGRNENDISNKVARMALTNQLFQVEVSKYSRQGGPNLIKNSGNPQDNKDWGYWEIGQNPAIRVGTHDFFFKNKRNLFYIVNETREAVPTSTIRFPLKRNTVYSVALTVFNTWNMKGATIYFLGKKAGESQSFTRIETLVDNTKFSSDEAVRKNYTFNSGECDEGFIRIDNNGTTDSDVATLLFGDVDVYEGTVTRPWQPSPEDDNEAVRSVQSQLDGSWAIQNLTSAGSIVSQINATNNQILIEAEKIRLKGKTLLDELTAIQGYFKRLFVGEGTFAKLNAEIIGSKTITADKLIMDQAMARLFVSSDIFTDTLAAKEAFINKLRSVVVTATLLEGYKGRIGGFQIGTHDNDPSSFWLTGLDQFKVGMSNGRGREFQTAFWANWGNDWGKPGLLSWYVTLEGEMYCHNNAAFHRVVDFSSASSVNFYGDNSFHKDIYMRGGTEIYGTGSTPRSNGQNAVVWWNQIGDGTVKYWIDNVSDRRLKRNIVDTDVNALNKINQLKMVAFDFIRTGKHEEIGLIAQDIESVLPSVISKNPEKEDDYLHIDYVAIVPYLIKSIQELNQKIEEMEKIVA
jgi:hypothetical protein